MLHVTSRGASKARFVCMLGILSFVALLAALPADHATANVRLAFPSEAPGPPYYARITATGAPQTDEWAAIVFYRDPDCVPADFNLLDFFDIPRAFGCPAAVEGFEIWRNGPGIDAAPINVVTRGSAPVAVWFVAPSELEAAMADGVLTIAELAALPSLQVGFAHHFREVLHPSEAARNAKLTMTAFGALIDGRRFQLQFSASTNTVRHTRIEVR